MIPKISFFTDFFKYVVATYASLIVHRYYNIIYLLNTIILFI
jgi:hypothetical protein